MRTDFLKRVFGFLIFFPFCAWSPVVFGQVRCLSPEDVKTFVMQVRSPQSVAFNKTLSKELLALKEGSERRLRADVENNKKADDLFQGLKETRNKIASALSHILKVYGWTRHVMVG